MNLYIVYGDTCTEDLWGAEIEIFGIFSTEEKAKKCVEKNKKYYLQIQKTSLDITHRVYLGGYIE